MAGDKDSLLKAATDNIPDPELQLAAKREMGECTVSTDSKLFKETMDRFAVVNRSARPDLWRWILPGLVTLISLLMASSHVIDGLKYYRLMKWDDPVKTIKLAQQELGARSWSPQQKALMFGDFGEFSTDHLLAILREGAGDDPVLLAEYLRVHLDKRASLPPDLHELVSKVDPDNSFFDYFTAASFAKDSVKETKRTYAEIKAKKPVSWDIEDPDALAKTIATLIEATAKPVFNSHTRGLMIKRATLLPWTTRRERASSAIFVFPRIHPGFILRGLTHSLCAEAHRLADTGDRDAFLRLTSAAETYWQQRLTDDDPTMLNCLLIQGDIAKMCGQFADAARALDLVPTEKRYLSIKDNLENKALLLDARRKTLTGREPISIRTGIEMRFADTLAHYVIDLPVHDETDLRPATYADHAFLSRALTLAVWAMLALAAGLLMFHYLATPRLIRVTGRQIARLVDWRDYTLIAFISFMIPVVYVMAISRLTPLGAREFNLRGTLGMLPASHFAALFLMMVAVATLAAQWRLRRRATVFGLGRGWSSVTGWVSLIAAALHVPLIGWYFTRDPLPDRQLLYAICGLLMPGVLILMSLVLQSTIGSFSHRLNNAAVVRILIPSFGLLMIGMLTLLPLFRAEDHHWIRQDIDINDPTFLFPYEKSLADRLNHEIREALRVE